MSGSGERSAGVVLLYRARERLWTVLLPRSRKQRLWTLPGCTGRDLRGLRVKGPGLGAAEETSALTRMTKPAIYPFIVLSVSTLGLLEVSFAASRIYSGYAGALRQALISIRLSYRKW